MPGRGTHHDLQSTNHMDRMKTWRKGIFLPDTNEIILYKPLSSKSVLKPHTLNINGFVPEASLLLIAKALFLSLKSVNSSFMLLLILSPSFVHRSLHFSSSYLPVLSSHKVLSPSQIGLNNLFHAKQPLWRAYCWPVICSKVVDCWGPFKQAAWKSSQMSLCH